VKVKARSGRLPCSFKALKPYSRPLSVKAIENGVDLFDCSFSTITSFLPGRIIEVYLGYTFISSEPKSTPIRAE
jgi:hypothetical protein